MKVLLKILVSLSLFVSLLGGLLFVWANNDNANTVETNPLFKVAEAMGSLGMDTGIGKLPTAGQYHAASAVDALFALSCVVGIVFAFLRGKTAGMVVAGAIAVLAILMIVLQPSFDGAALQEENSDKVLATVIGIIGLVGAGLLLALKMVRDKPAPQTA